MVTERPDEIGGYIIAPGELMKRCMVLAALMTIGALSLTLSGLQAPPEGPTTQAL